MWGSGRKKNENVRGVGGTPGSSHANPTRNKEKRFSKRVTGSIESDTPDRRTSDGARRTLEDVRWTLDGHWTDIRGR